MRQYRVRWQIEVEAETAGKAAIEAWRYLRSLEPKDAQALDVVETGALLQLNSITGEVCGDEDL